MIGEEVRTRIEKGGGSNDLICLPMECLNSDFKVLITIKQTEKVKLEENGTKEV